ncbi:MAG: hypothetical protein HYY24_09050 [Verrucomicrobia bacterium]|nr:hypothetical protein [Verrucomicrobiota bacterium]
MPPTAPEKPKDRFEVYRFFNGLSIEGKSGLDEGRTRVPLVKTFLLEHVSGRSNRQPRQPADIFRELGNEVWPVDDTFLRIKTLVKQEQNQPPKMEVVGFLEQYDERFFAYYTVEPSQEARVRVRRWVSSAADLDSTWFSSQLLLSLWHRDVSHRGDARYSKLTFRHESIFELTEDAAHLHDEESASEETADPDHASEDQPEPERRNVRSEMGDRIGRIRAALEKLQENYAPLYALYSLRFPSRAQKGSHDLFQHGQITNRSDSFEDHRNTARYLYRAYKSVLEATEDVAWNDVKPPPRDRAFGVNFKGVPLIVRFNEELTESTFRRWIVLAFKKRGIFRLWGDPVWLGRTKVHVYGADRHLWQPIHLELTKKGIVAILPTGTCGNTFHRLVTNIQRFVCPKIDAWLGPKPFTALTDAVANSLEGSGEK